MNKDQQMKQINKKMFNQTGIAETVTERRMHLIRTSPFRQLFDDLLWTFVCPTEKQIVLVVATSQIVCVCDMNTHKCRQQKYVCKHM